MLRLIMFPNVIVSMNFHIIKLFDLIFVFVFLHSQTLPIDSFDSGLLLHKIMGLEMWMVIVSYPTRNISKTSTFTNFPFLPFLNFHFIFDFILHLLHRGFLGIQSTDYCPTRFDHIQWQLWKSFCLAWCLEKLLLRAITLWDRFLLGAHFRPTIIQIPMSPFQFLLTNGERVDGRAILHSIETVVVFFFACNFLLPLQLRLSLPHGHRRIYMRNGGEILVGLVPQHPAWLKNSNTINNEHYNSYNQIVTHNKP